MWLEYDGFKEKSRPGGNHSNSQEQKAMCLARSRELSKKILRNGIRSNLEEWKSGKRNVLTSLKTLILRKKGVVYLLWIRTLEKEKEKKRSSLTGHAWRRLAGDKNQGSIGFATGITILNTSIKCLM